MRRTIALLALLLLFASSAAAQIGTRVALQAGTPEDRAFAEIVNAPDSAKKLALLEKFLADFGADRKMTLLAYETILGIHAAEKNFDQAFAYGDKILSLAPEQFEVASQLVRLAQEKGDTEKLFAYGEKAGEILERYQSSPPPDGESAESWEQAKKSALADVQDEVQYIHYTLFNTGYQAQDPAQRAALLERFAKAFPKSPYAPSAESLVAAAHQQTQNYAKMLEFAQGVLARDADNVGMLLLLADYWSERGEQLDKAEEFANKALAVLEKAQQPERLTEEQWTQHKSLQQGLAYTALGQVHIHKNRLAQAEAAFRQAGPLLQSDAITYGRNLYRLGFTLARARKTAEARKVLQEAVNMKGPYSPYAQETLNKLGPAPPAKRRP